MNIQRHEASIEETTYEKAKIISEFIEKNVIRVMEKGKHFEIQRVINNFNYKRITKINILAPDGTIKVSTRKEELGKNVGDVNLFLKNPYFIREEAVQHEDKSEGTERIYYFNTLVLNKPECFYCHNSNAEMVGILTVATSLREMDEEISKVKKEAVFISILTIGAISFLLGLLFFRFVNAPIRKLIGVMKRVEEGDLNVRVDIKGRDEMARLARNLNTMIEKLNIAKKEGEEYHQELIRRADRMASIGELASGIAHEIRNPLAGIQGAIQILAQEFPKEDGRRKVADEIQKQIYKLERLVKDLLNYVKPVPKDYAPTDINQLIEKVLSFFITQQGKWENFKMEKNLFTPLPRVMIDPNSMEQAFLNIIINARKAMPQGGTFTVSTHFLNHKTEKDEGDEIDRVQIIFEDTGIGISKDNLPKVFNPFFSTRSDGTGLGLSITKNIIEQHGGCIEVESQINVGTKFIINLPLINNA